MKAKEMFEQLGYKYEIKFSVPPSSDMILCSSHNNRIKFYKDTKRVETEETLCIMELKAIIHQFKELEWLDDNDA